MLPNLQNFLINRFYEAETSTDKQMLMLVVHQKEVDYVTTRIKRVCPETFMHTMLMESDGTTCQNLEIWS